jgi:arsenate reductase-like glutaredoxin family protein
LINIISTQVDKDKITGPKKVLINTCKGLDNLGVKYVFNKCIKDYDYNWIQDNSAAIIEASLLNKPVIIGPNTAVLPKDLPILRPSLSPDSIYLCPSQWVVNMWKESGFVECKIRSWPVGIDLDNFDRKKDGDNGSNKTLVYFKQRDKAILENTKQLLKNKNIEYEVIHYGFYKEEEYKRALNESKLCIWIGCSESQGIALQEALATGIPMIVLDAKSLFDAVSENKKGYYDYKVPKSLDNIETSSAPYFDDRCGLKIDNIGELDKSIDYILDNIDTLLPREYIEENLSLEISSKKLVDMFSTIKIDREASTSSNNYQIISKVLFYIDLFFKGWFYSWIFFKVKSFFKKSV